jgi:RimJ/RimL family protein N-acetyltransferase
LNFERTKDYWLVRKILTMRDVYEHMGDDYLPAPEAFMVNTHPDAWYVVARKSGLVGLFSLFPSNRVCWQVHACMLPDADTREKWEAARELAPWLAQHTDCVRLVAEIPRSNKPAIHFAIRGGMRYVGTHRAAFQKYGKLQDLIILGREVNGDLA